jgi:hypothetical protein
MTTGTISPLRQGMIEDMNARKLCEGTQRSHIQVESGASIHNRNRIMTGVKFLLAA